MRVPAPRKEEYGVCVTATRAFSRLLEQVDQAQAVVAQQQRVGVESEQVVGVRDDEVGRIGTLDTGGARCRIRRLLAGGTAAHQADVGVEVHGLVGLVRERRVLLALEGRDLGREGPRAGARCSCSIRSRDGASFCSVAAVSACALSQNSPARPPSTCSTKNSSTWSSICSLAGHAVDPLAATVCRSARRCTSSGETQLDGSRGRNFFWAAPNRAARLTHGRRDVGGERACRSSRAATAGSVGEGGSSSSSTTRKPGKSCNAADHRVCADDGRLLRVGGYEHRHRRLVPREVAVELGARNPDMLAESLERPCLATRYMRAEKVRKVTTTT